MTEARRPGAISLVVLCYALCGPAIGTFIVTAFVAAAMLFQADPKPNYGPHDPYGGFLLLLSFGLPFGYVLGALPAVATALVSVCVSRFSARWGRNPFVSGFIGAAMSTPLLALSVFDTQQIRPSTASLWYGVYPALGFVAAFCCHGVAQHFERRAALADRPDHVNGESTT
jgi:hypothetical protein